MWKRSSFDEHLRNISLLCVFSGLTWRPFSLKNNNRIFFLYLDIFHETCKNLIFLSFQPVNICSNRTMTSKIISKDM